MSAHRPQPCILVVEDEQVLLTVLQRMLSKSYRVLTATTLAEATAHLESGRADLLLTDLKLLGGERGEALIDRYHGALPCIAMTAFGDRELERNVRERGAVGYLSKPFGSQQLFAAVGRALEAPAEAHQAGCRAPDPGDVAVVLSGGGVRSAYEVGVLQGIVEVLERGSAGAPPFRTFVGSSVGALNATWLATHTHRGDLHLDGLAELWSSLTYRELISVDWRSLLRRSGTRWRSLLHVGPLAELVRGAIDWQHLHDNVDAGRTRALVVPSLEIRSGLSTLFAELAPGVSLDGPSDPRRRVRRTRITAEHLLAAAAIPGMLPPRAVEGGLYVDGAVRHNVPLASAIRTGATHAVVVSPLSLQAPPAAAQPGPPGLAFLVGKLLEALLLDPLQRDLRELERFNHLLDVLGQELEPEQMARVSSVITEARGMPFRPVSTLVFTPSQDLGGLAQRFLEDEFANLDLPRLHRYWFARFLDQAQPTAQADWATYVLFDGALARHFLALGRADAHARAAEVRRFFGAPGSPGA